MKTEKLVAIFNALKGSLATISFADLLRQGFSSVLIFNAINLTNSKITKNNSGYSVIAFV